MATRDYWFRAMRFGFGSGLPIHWKGWAMMALHIAAIIGVALLLEGHKAAAMAAIALVGFLPLPLYAARTEGGWRWRWGDRS